MNIPESFIIQTALDYDVPVSVVERIYNIYPRSQFYEKLEEYIKNRPEEDGQT